MTALKLCPRHLKTRQFLDKRARNAALYPLALVACSLARSADAITSRIRVNSVW